MPASRSSRWRHDPLQRSDLAAAKTIEALTAPDAAIPSLVLALVCENRRLAWQHGIVPTQIAMRRMRDSLIAVRADDYARANARLVPYVNAAPAGDATCGAMRGARAADALNRETIGPR